MNKILLISADEWRHWYRSRLALWSIFLFVVLLISIGTLNTLKIADEKEHRLEHQRSAEEIFTSQPDRHPHRMVHFGHYAFRTPSPLAIIDPGLDSVTGQSIYLEGHRQNTATFDNSSVSADLGGLSWLSPALVYQWYAPLLLILLGYSSIVRERESATLSTMLLQGVRGWQLITGKFLALFSISCLLLLPLFITGLVVENFSVSLVLTTTYLLYFSIWAILIVIASALFHKRTSVLTSLITLWLFMCLLVPSTAVDIESNALKAKNKIELDLQMLVDLRKLGDGHNANDPAFEKIKADLLAKHNVDRVEDLPVNFRGIVAAYAEEKLTKVLNQYASERMAAETQQAEQLSTYGWISPALAIANASRAISATDLYHYHHFLNEAEALRFAFVQGLNELQAKGITYSDDINRSRDPEAEKRTRVSAKNWQLLNDFKLEPVSLEKRFEHAQSSIIKMLLWLFAIICFAFVIGGRLKP